MDSPSVHGEGGPPRARWVHPREADTGGDAHTRTDAHANAYGHGGVIVIALARALASWSSFHTSRYPLTFTSMRGKTSPSSKSPSIERADGAEETERGRDEGAGARRHETEASPLPPLSTVYVKFLRPGCIQQAVRTSVCAYTRNGHVKPSHEATPTAGLGSSADGDTNRSLGAASVSVSVPDPTPYGNQKEPCAVTTGGDKTASISKKRSSKARDHSASNGTGIGVAIGSLAGDPVLVVPAVSTPFCLVRVVPVAAPFLFSFHLAFFACDAVSREHTVRDFKFAIANAYVQLKAQHKGLAPTIALAAYPLERPLGLPSLISRRLLRLRNRPHRHTQTARAEEEDGGQGGGGERNERTAVETAHMSQAQSQMVPDVKFLVAGTTPAPAEAEAAVNPSCVVPIRMPKHSSSSTSSTSSSSSSSSSSIVVAGGGGGGRASNVLALLPLSIKRRGDTHTKDAEDDDDGDDDDDDDDASYFWTTFKRR